jgi:hypothetical protein
LSLNPLRCARKSLDLLDLDKIEDEEEEDIFGFRNDELVIVND